MKTKILTAIIACFLTTLVSASNSATGISTTFVNNKYANTVVFGAVNGHRQQNGVALSWQIVPGAAVTGFIIERSYDGVSFELVGAANTVASGWNRFKDSSVYPGYIHYKIGAIMQDGSIVYSEIEIVRIVSKK